MPDGNLSVRVRVRVIRVRIRVRIRVIRVRVRVRGSICLCPPSPRGVRDNFSFLISAHCLPAIIDVDVLIS